MAPSEVHDASRGEDDARTERRRTSRGSRISKTRLSSTAKNDSKSFRDLDETLHLPEEIQRKHDEDSQRQQPKGTSKSGEESDGEIAMDVDEGADEEFRRVPIIQNDSGQGNASNQNNEAREETSMPKLSEENYTRNCRRLLCILKGERPRSNSTFAGNSNFTSDFTISGEDAASLLEYLTKLHKGEILFADLGGILSNENENDSHTSSCRHENMNHNNNNEFRSSEMESNLGWNLVKWAVKVAIYSLNNSIKINNSNDRSNTNQNSGEKMATFDPVTAKRILVDGILPFASLSSPAHLAINCLNNYNSPKTPTGQVSTAIAMPTSTSTMMTTKGNNIGAAQTQITQAQIQKKIHTQSAYIFNLISSIVADELLPLALVPASTSATTSNAPLTVRNEIGNENSLFESHGQINTMPLELLLSSFVTRMDSEEVSPNYHNYCHHEGEDECFMTVDAILDKLCCAPPSKPNFYFHNSTSNAKKNNKSKPSTMEQKNTANCTANPWQLRPHSTAALLATLRELESILPGRLSRIRVWRNFPGVRQNHIDGACATAESGISNIQAEFQYHYLDRPTYICQAALFSLSRLSCKEENDSVNIYDPDALPPLVYQLGLFPMGALRGCEPANVAGGGGGLKGVIKTANVSGGENENEKQRGKRIRRLCLEGIAGVLDDAEFDVAHGRFDNNRSRSDNNGNDALVIRRNDALSKPSTSNQKKRQEEEVWRWTQYTCLSHMGSCMRSDPEMANTVISMLSGECDSTLDSILTDAANGKDGSEIPPFRYQRITPFKLAMGLSMASSVPRVRSLALRALQDLIMEEETIRIRRGLDVEGNTLGMGQPWMNCLVKCLEFSSGCETEVVDVDRNIGHGRRLSRMLRCLLSVATFAESSEHGVGVGSGGGGGGSASNLLQSLLSLGFLLIDAVKKDDIIDLKSPALHSSSVLAPTMDISSLGGGTASRADTSAIHAAAGIGRFLLCYLFYQSAAGSSHFLSRSLSSMTASSSTDGGTPLCRSILRSAVDKFCGMAPNALGHAQLLIDFLEFTPRSSIQFFPTRGNAGGEELDEKQKEEVIPVAFAAFHLQPLIECFANVPGGGLNPAVASNAIIPVVENLLLLQATSRSGLAGYLWKKRDLEDHIDHAFLLAKKALFCSDVEKRKFAATLLVALLRVASVASSLHDIRATSTWCPVIDELRGCLRRCITQHQPSVRIEAYSSLVSVLPSSAIAVFGSTQSQDSVSPHPNVSGVTTTPLRSPNERGRAHVSQAGQKAIINIVSDVFLSQLERYVTTPQEDSRDREARRQRAINIGSQLSQMETGENRDDGISMPFRFEACISTRPINRMDNKSKGGKPKKSSPVGQTLLEEATGRINEPLSHLFASSSAASSLDPQGELRRCMDRIRNRMAHCNDIDSYLKWVESCKQIVGINDDAKRTEEMAVTKLATLVVVANVADVLIGTTNFNAENDNPQVTNYESTDQIVERLFNLRSDAITRAVEIMSSFVNVKPKREAKAPKKSKDVVGTNHDSESKAKNGEVYQTKLAKTSDVNPATVARNQKLIEDVLSLCPALPLEFIAPAFRKFGALASASKKTNRNDSDDEDNLQSNFSRLIYNMPFRRFIITKSLLLVSGASTVIRAGSRFCSIPSNPIAAYMSLGPLLLAEFCSLCYDLENTSIATKNSASQSTHYLSLTQLSLRAFSFCVHGLSTSTTNQAMSNAQRVQFMISNAIRIASRAAPSSKDGWDYYQSLNVQGNNAPQDEIELKKSLTPFVSFKVDANAPVRLCLFSELMRSSMYGEAIECCHLIKAAAASFSEPSIKHHLSVMLLRCFEQIKQVGVGLLSLDHGEGNQNESCVCYAIDTAFELNNNLDGDTFVPFPHGFLGLDLMSKKGFQLARSKMGLTSMCPNYWPEKHLDRLMDEFSSQLGCPGTIQQITWALTVQLGCSSIFSEVMNSSSPVTKRNSGLACIRSASKTSGSNFAKETRSIANMISASIESGLNSAEFVTAKLIPHMSGSTLNMAQRLVMCLLMSASKVIHASSPSAEFVDTSGSFASLLLKSTKKLYSILARLLLSFLANPHSLESSETKCLLKYLASNLMQSVAALLYTLQEKHETTGGKFLTENKIETHGKISALLVCEKEKLDNAFLKIGAKLKHVGVRSDWLQEYSFISLNRDFVIKRADIQLAKEREAPRTKKNTVSGDKRKINCETSGKMMKQKKNDKAAVPVAKIVEGDEEVDDVSHDSGGDEEFESDDNDVVSLGNLTNDMGDNDLSEGEDLDGDSFNADSNEHSSSEIEFDSENE